MKKNTFILLCAFISMLGYISCSGDDGEQEIRLSNENTILSFLLTVNEENFPLSFENGEASLLVPALTDITNLTPSIRISDKAKIKPALGTPQDFTKPVTYTVTAENGDVKKFTVRISVEKPSADNSITSFEFINLPENTTTNKFELLENDLPNTDVLSIKVPYLSPINALKTRIVISEHAVIEPASGKILDYTKPVVYTVTAQNGDIKKYIVKVDGNLDQVKFKEGLVDAFKNKKPGDLITFNVSEAHQIKDRIHVYLTDLLTQSKITIPVQDVQEIDEDTHTITTKLPATYINSDYRLEISIEDGNNDVSEIFRLDKGIPNFVQVEPVDMNGNFSTIEKLFSTHSTNFTKCGDIRSKFIAKMYIDISKRISHNFYLRQNGKDFVVYPQFYETWNEESSTVEIDIVCDMLQDGAVSGTNYTFIIETPDDGVKHEFPFVNHQGNSIEVIPLEPLVIQGIDKEVYTRGDEISMTISGDLHINTTSSNLVSKENELSVSFFKIEGEGDQEEVKERYETTISSIENASFRIPDNIPVGTYGIHLIFTDNIGNKSFKSLADIVIE
ncbi:hypothetical protein HN014_11040 [Aquimarina sp. TRL1]|uniref:DUF5018-related domain-containing protein n=1 Tax=Aquimarina sp. (strain TRL1) TaxID=2736252 RepID=UPI00158E6717|nr:hypothetical protein [Aquimarina sp. TRL1]QKX05427.1 hypothetical protein HN014_11040 [Aquimarina sp. TRL1]